LAGVLKGHISCGKSVATLRVPVGERYAERQSAYRFQLARKAGLNGRRSGLNIGSDMDSLDVSAGHGPYCEVLPDPTNIDIPFLLSVCDVFGIEGRPFGGRITLGIVMTSCIGPAFNHHLCLHRVVHADYELIGANPEQGANGKLEGRIPTLMLANEYSINEDP